MTITGVSARNSIYNGQSQQGYSGKPASDYKGEYEISYNTPDGKAPTNAGSYTVTFKVPDSDPQYAGGTVLNFTIAKAAVTIKAEDKSAYAGDARPALTYTVAGLADGENLKTAPTLFCDANMSKTGIYAITADGAEAPQGGNYDSKITYMAGKLTVNIRPSSEGPAIKPNPLPVTTEDVEKNGQTGTATTAKPESTTRGDMATADILSGVGQELVKQAEKNDSDTVVIAPEIKGNVAKTEVSIPSEIVSDLGSKTDADLVIETPVAAVTIPNGELKNLAAAGGKVTITAENKGGSITLAITSGGENVAAVAGGVTLTVPYENGKPGTVAVLIRENGTREVIRKSVANGDEPVVTIPLKGSAALEIIDNGKTFEDVPAQNWAADAVTFVSGHELFTGTGANTFSPDASMTRGMLAKVLHNLENNPDHAFSSKFDDVGNGQWFSEAVSWAAEKGIVSGYSNGSFGADDSISREQLAAMLYRYAGSPAASAGELNFSDADKIDGYAMNAMRWAVENGIISGKGNSILDPKGQATRAQVAAMLMRYLKAQK